MSNFQDIADAGIALILKICTIEAAFLRLLPSTNSPKSFSKNVPNLNIKFDKIKNSTITYPKFYHKPKILEFQMFLAVKYLKLVILVLESNFEEQTKLTFVSKKAGCKLLFGIEILGVGFTKVLSKS